MAPLPVSADERRRHKTALAKARRQKALLTSRQQHHQECQRNPFIRLIHSSNQPSQAPLLPQPTLRFSPTPTPATEQRPAQAGSQSSTRIQHAQERRRSPRLAEPIPHRTEDVDVIVVADTLRQARRLPIAYSPLGLASPRNPDSTARAKQERRRQPTEADHSGSLLSLGFRI